MTETIRKHWTSLLGALFLICSVSYLFKYSVDQGWITDSMKIGTGLLLGAGLGLIGFKLIASRRQAAGEITSGLGAAVLYTTFSFSGIYFALWDSMTVFLCMVAVTVALTFLAYRYGLRILMNIALLGALSAPLVMRPESDQVFTLFLYLLVINTAYFYLSIRRQWQEARLVSFLGTWLLYAVYYVLFDPALDSVWSLPFRYAAAAFVFYVIGFLISSWKSNQCFDGLNLYLGFANAVLFGVWSVTILDGLTSYSYPLFAMGLLYVLLAYLVFRLTGKTVSSPVLVKLVGGVFLLLVAVSQLGQGMEIKPLISVFVWGTLAALLLVPGKKLRNDWLMLFSFLIWIGVTLYWFSVTWETPRGEWFGTYIPFLNWGAMAWILLAALGFYYSLRGQLSGVKDAEVSLILSRIFSVISHIIVGGLLTVQVENVFEEYELSSFFDMEMTLSVVWGIYALLLFLWGAFSKQQLFRYFGSAVLLLVTVKVLLLDLSGADTIYKVLVLFVMGCISLSITYINNKWKVQTPKPAAGEEAAAEIEV